MTSPTADKFGTLTEQRRYAAAWLSPGFRYSDASYEPDKRCRSCRHVTKFVGYRCQKHGFTTAANAVCGTFVRSGAA